MSFKLSIHPKRKSATRLIGKVGSGLQRALIGKKAEIKKAGGKFTQADLARRLDLDRSVVNRYFSGYANLTLGTLGELAWALDQEVDVVLRPKVQQRVSNEQHQFAATYRSTGAVSGAHTFKNSAGAAKGFVSVAATARPKMMVRASNG